MFSFPLPVESLQKWMPHRSPAVCVDEVVWVGKEEGECRTTFRQPNPSMVMAIETLAQAFGFVTACQCECGLIPKKDGAKETYLVGLRNFQFFTNPSQEWILHVVRTHHIGPLVLVRGTIRTPNQNIVAQGELKLYAA